MDKIDIHLHLTLEQLPKNEQMFISSAEAMLPHLKELGITKGILMSSGEGRNQEQLVGSNRECRHITDKFPEVYSWMCNLDPADGETVYDRLKSCKEKGAVGVGEFMAGRRLDDDFIQAVFCAAERLELPVLFHMSPQVGYQYGIVDEPGLPLLEDNLKRYPALKFIGHSQPFWHEITGNAGSSLKERMEWGKGKIVPGGRVPYLFDTYPNLYGDLSANSGGCALMRDEAFGIEFLKKNGSRLMFGTDMVNTDMEFPLGKWLDKIYEDGKIDKEVYEAVCRRNAAELFGIE